MPEFSAEFWAATVVAVVLALITLLIGLGVTLAIDANTRGEFRFVVGCFIFSAFMIASTIGLWDVTTQATMSKRILISALLFAIVGVLLVETVRWTYGRHQHAVMMTKSKMEPANTESHEAADSRASTPVKNIDESKPSSPPPIRPPAKPSHHPPKVKQWAVTTMIPFEKTENGGGVPVEDLNAISRDPLSKTYSDIRDVARLRAKIDNNLNPIPATDDEAVDKTNEALRYCLLRWIAEIQDPVTLFIQTRSRR